MSYIQRCQQITTGAMLSLTVGVGVIFAPLTVGQKTISSVALAQPTFSDIGGHLYQTQIQQAASLGFIAGFENGTFRPNETVTREQAVSIILAAIGVTDSQLGGPSQPFRDVPRDRWSARKIAYAASRGIVVGRDPGRFDPAATVTRAELMAMLKKVADAYFSGRTQGAGVNFSDTAGHWASDTIGYMSRYCGVATPLNELGSSFAPNGGATRGYTAAAIVRLHGCGQASGGTNSRESTSALPGRAQILDFGGNGSAMTVKPRANASPVSIAGQPQIQDGGSLLIQDEMSWASFGMVGGDEKYAGLWIKATGEGTYRFRCQFAGDFLIGWSASGGACRGNREHLELAWRLAATQAPKPLAQIARSLGIGNKQLNANAGNTLLVDPADGVPVLIETRLDQATGSYTIKVWQGSIEIKSSESTPGITVNAGQVYVHRGGDASNADISNFNEIGTPAACPIFDAFKSPGDSSSEALDDLNRAISAQAAQHQSALGLSGTPAQLSPYEQAIVDEINRARTNPRTYAQEFQQFFEAGGPPSPLYESDSASANGYSEMQYDSPETSSLSTTSYRGPVPPLSTSVGLSAAARELVVEQGLTGNIGKYGTATRLLQYGEAPCHGSASREGNAFFFPGGAWELWYLMGTYGELVYYGAPPEPRTAALQLIGRWGYDLLNPAVSVIGINCGGHLRLEGVCSIFVASSFIEKTP